MDSIPPPIKMKKHVGSKRKTDVDNGVPGAEVPAKKVKTSTAKLLENKSGPLVKTTTGRPRGRPRKDASATPIFKSETNPNLSTRLSPTPPPKKRGRPPKPKPIEPETTIQPQPTPSSTQPATHLGIPGQPSIPPRGGGDDIAIPRNQLLRVERYQKQKVTEEATAKSNEEKLPSLVRGTFVQTERGFFLPAPGYEPFLSGGCNGISREAFLESWKTGEDPVVMERRFRGVRKAVFGGGGGRGGGGGDAVGESVGRSRGGERGGSTMGHEPVEPPVTKPWFGASARPVFASGSNGFRGRGRGGGIDDGNGLFSRSQSIFSGGSGCDNSRPLAAMGQMAGVNAGILSGGNSVDHSSLLGNALRSPGSAGAGARAVCPAFVTNTSATNMFGGAKTSSSTIPWTDKLSKPFSACSTTNKK